MNTKRIAWLGLLAAVGIGCQVANSDGLAEAPAEALAELSEVPGGVFCGDRRCETDEVCCSEACGICTQPGASCDRSACLQAPECSKDSDCKVEADYCVDCHCVALNSEEQLAECPGPGVQCFADPCVGKSAVCKNERCVME
jgi:hypothetical protein